MKTITARKELLKKLEKNHLITDGNIFYLSDFHKQKVGNSISQKLINERILEPTAVNVHWFEKAFKIRKSIGTYLSVKIFKDDQRNQFFFSVKKGVYYIDTYDLCIQKLDYLNALNEPLS